MYTCKRYLSIYIYIYIYIYVGRRKRIGAVCVWRKLERRKERHGGFGEGDKCEEQYI